MSGTHNIGIPRNEGEAHPQARLDEHDIYLIRELAKDGDITQTEIAKKFEVTPGHISEIVHRKTWRHIA